MYRSGRMFAAGRKTPEGQVQLHPHIRYMVQAIVKRIMVVDTERIVDLRRTSGVTVGDADGCWQSWGSDIINGSGKVRQSICTRII